VTIARPDLRTTGQFSGPRASRPHASTDDVLKSPVPGKLAAQGNRAASSNWAALKNSRRPLPQVITMSLPPSLPIDAPEVLEREFLEIRAKLLQLAASFDRFDRGAGNVDSDPRRDLIRRGLDILQSDATDKAEQIQLLFSREYDDNWQQTLDMPAK